MVKGGSLIYTALLNIEVVYSGVSNAVGKADPVGAY
jgi:hypothetical protein